MAERERKARLIQSGNFSVVDEHLARRPSRRSSPIKWIGRGCNAHQAQGIASEMAGILFLTHSFGQIQRCSMPRNSTPDDHGASEHRTLASAPTVGSFARTRASRRAMEQLEPRTLASAPTVGSFARTRALRRAMEQLEPRTLASAPTVGSFARTRAFRRAMKHRSPALWRVRLRANFSIAVRRQILFSH